MQGSGAADGIEDAAAGDLERYHNRVSLPVARRSSVDGHPPYFAKKSKTSSQKQPKPAHAR